MVEYFPSVCKVIESIPSTMQESNFKKNSESVPSMSNTMVPLCCDELAASGGP